MLRLNFAIILSGKFFYSPIILKTILKIYHTCQYHSLHFILVTVCYKRKIEQLCSVFLIGDCTCSIRLSQFVYHQFYAYACSVLVNPLAYIAFKQNSIFYQLFLLEYSFSLPIILKLCQHNS